MSDEICTVGYIRLYCSADSKVTHCIPVRFY